MSASPSPFGPLHPAPALAGTLLPSPARGTPAEQCASLGLAIGSIIIGRETLSNGHWSDAKLTLLWVGKELAVWRVHRRSHKDLDWKETGEQSNWTLDVRDWYLQPDNSA